MSLANEVFHRVPYRAWLAGQVLANQALCCDDGDLPALVSLALKAADLLISQLDSDSIFVPADLPPCDSCWGAGEASGEDSEWEVDLAVQRLPGRKGGNQVSRANAPTGKANPFPSQRGCV